MVTTSVELTLCCALQNSPSTVMGGSSHVFVSNLIDLSYCKEMDKVLQSTVEVSEYIVEDMHGLS